MSVLAFDQAVIASWPGAFDFAGFKRAKAALKFGGRIVRSDTSKLPVTARRDADGLELTHSTLVLVLHFETRRYHRKDFRWVVNNWWGTLSEPEIFLRESSIILNTEATQNEAEDRFRKVVAVWRETGSLVLPGEPIILDAASDKSSQANRNATPTGAQTRLTRARAKYLAHQFPHTSKAFLEGNAQAATKALSHEFEIAQTEPGDPVERLALAHYDPSVTMKELTAKICASLKQPSGSVNPDSLSKTLSRKYDLTAPRGITGPRAKV